MAKGHQPGRSQGSIVMGLKLQILSDLHLEMMKPPYSWQIPETSAELIVLAGDIGRSALGVGWAIRETERLDKPIVYVPGNHEYYKESLTVAAGIMRGAARGSKVRVLDMDEFAWNGVRFLGLTLWTDYSLFGRKRRTGVMKRADLFLNDHRLINWPYGFTPGHALERHTQGRAWLEAKLADGWNGPTVVITHHAPSLLGTDTRFHSDLLTAAFVSNLEDVIQHFSPPLWVHGHTHHCIQYMIGSTRVVSNQKGYPHEPATGQFDPSLVVEI
jgi:Icc-related predicted phosphoesterase